VAGRLAQLPRTLACDARSRQTPEGVAVTTAELLQISAAQIRRIEVLRHHAREDSIRRTFAFNDLDRFPQRHPC